MPKEREEVREEKRGRRKKKSELPSKSFADLANPACCICIPE